MKLAEALALRSELNDKMNDLSVRMVSSALVQEGTKPAEDAKALLAQCEEVASQLQRLIASINKTNLVTKLSDGRTLTDALAERDVLLLRIGFHRRLAEGGVLKQTIQTRSEVRFRTMVDVSGLRKKVDELSHEHRRLDVMIQSANWASELIEE